VKGYNCQQKVKCGKSIVTALGQHQERVQRQSSAHLRARSFGHVFGICSEASIPKHNQQRSRIRSCNVGAEKAKGVRSEKSSADVRLSSHFETHWKKCFGKARNTAEIFRSNPKTRIFLRRVHSQKDTKGRKRRDALAKAASQGTPLPSEVLRAPSGELQERVVLSISPVSSEDWRSEIIAYLCDEHHSDDEAWSTRMTQRTRRYKMVNEELYKEGVSALMLKCIAREEGIDLMKEIHAGFCGSHMGPRALLGKTLRAGFYWPKSAADVERW
jgi:hypothetical protein